MTAKDPYPGSSFQEEALPLLITRFPGGNIDYHPSNGDVFISLPLKSGETFRAGLTWQQAKYLAYSELTGDHLKDGLLPADWPGEN